MTIVEPDKTKFKIGDCVRIKTPKELKGRKVQYGSAIDKWQNEICIVRDVRPSIVGVKYMIDFCAPRKCEEDRFACRVRIDEFWWEEYELALVEEKTVDADAFSQLIGGEIL